MILNKYQLHSQIQNRGYSATAIVIDEVEELYFAKWIKGIPKDSPRSKVLSRKLRTLKKASHSSTPKIIEYGWDLNEGAYCIIFEYIEAITLEDKLFHLSPTYFLKGLIQLLDCLKEFNQKHRISHGDITPANILVDEDLNFYLIDFGLSDISATLSQEASLEIFAREFAAPEKLDRSLKASGFPFQSDVFSLGRVIEWYFSEKELDQFQSINDLVDATCKKVPSERLKFNMILDLIQKIVTETSFDNKNIILVEKATDDIIRELNSKTFRPLFDVSPSDKGNILIHIITESFCIRCLWILDELYLTVLNTALKEEDEENYIRSKKRATYLMIPVDFVKYNSQYSYNKFNLTLLLKKIRLQKQYEGSYSKGKREIYKELKFFKDLIEKELEVIEKNALKLKYSKFDKKGNQIWFTIDIDDKYSPIGFIFNHIRNSLPPNEDEFEYIVSATADKKQMKNPLRFSGIAYDFDIKKRIIKFKDCEHLDFDKIPARGYIFENTAKQEQEKKRQKEAIRKVEYDEVENRDLIYYLFNPNDIDVEPVRDYELEHIYQTDDKGKSFEYSPNQTMAILNALHLDPLSIIQGPPGTGKTTVITEIVFQILHNNPDAKILITSQTNDAVDNVLDNLLEKDIPILRLSGFRKPKQSLRKHTLERKIEGWKQEVRKKAQAKWKPIKEAFEKEVEKDNIILSRILEIISSNKKWNEKKQQIDNLIAKFNFNDLEDALVSETVFMEALSKMSKADFKGFFEKQKLHNDWLATISSLDENSKLNQKLIDTIRVIGATTNHIASKKYQKYNFEFDYVIMDESGKATTAESLIPLVMANKAVLVGDHRQLRPMLTANREVEKWLRSKHNEEFDSFDDYFNRPSLFEQIITQIDSDYKSQLEVCRRCSEDQVKLISQSFYEPYSDEPIQYVARHESKEHNLDLKVDSSIIFLDIGNSIKSQKDGSGSSYNQESANLIPQLIKKLDQQEQVKGYSIGVITGYTAQMKKIRKAIQSEIQPNKLKHIKLYEQVVSSVVDRFQGLEKDIIIFDLVRSRENTLGFLANANRVNVALSRQKRLIIIIGNYDWIVQAKAPNDNEDIPALQRYLRAINRKWIVKSIEQIF